MSEQSAAEEVPGSHRPGQAEVSFPADHAQGFTNQPAHATENFPQDDVTVSLHSHNNGVDDNDDMHLMATPSPRDDSTRIASTSPLVSGRSSLEQDEQSTGPSYPILTQQKEAPRSSSPPSIYQYAPFYIEWRWELITWSLGTCAIAVTLILLCRFKDKSLTKWHSKVQLSAIVAVLSQVAQSALAVSVTACIGQSKWSFLRSNQRIIEIQRFDEASRGPEGSLKLLALTALKLKGSKFAGVQFILVAVGTLTTLMMLAFGAFTQQTVTIGLRQVKNATGSLGSVSSALSYRHADFIPTSPDNSTTVSSNYLLENMEPTDVILSSAVIAGATANHSLSDIVAQCPTGQCEWEPYTSFSVCSSFEDISSELVNIDSDPKKPYLNLTLPGTDLYNDARSFYVSVGPSVGVTYAEEISLDQIVGPLNAIAEVYLIYYPPCVATNNTPGLIQDVDYWYEQVIKKDIWKAFKGTFHLCLQSFTTSIDNASTTTTAGPRYDHDASWQLGPDNTTITTVFYPASPDQELAGTTPNSMDILSMGYLSNALRRTLNGSASLSPGGDNYWDSDIAASIAQDVYGLDPMLCTQGPNVGFGGFQNRLNNISVSLTNTLRRNPMGNTMVSGSTLSSEQYIQVDLRWFSLPLILWLSTTFLLIMTIWRTSSLDMPAWKSSTLPLVHCRDSDSGYGSNKKMKEAARARGIQLKTDGARWYLDVKT